MKVLVAIVFWVGVFEGSCAVFIGVESGFAWRGGHGGFCAILAIVCFLMAVPLWLVEKAN